MSSKDISLCHGFDFPIFLALDDVATDRNTIVFQLQVACTRNYNAVQGETNPFRIYDHANGKPLAFWHDS